MIEIVGMDLDLAVEELGINAIKTFEQEKEEYVFQVWELSEEEFEKLNAVADEDWKDEWGFWRGGESNLGIPTANYTINGVPLLVWENTRMKDDKEWEEQTEYNDLQEYLIEAVGASKEGNVALIACDIARHNNIKASELLRKTLKS